MAKRKQAPPGCLSAPRGGGGGQDQGDNDMSLTENSPGAAAGLTPFVWFIRNVSKCFSIFWIQEAVI